MAASFLNELARLRQDPSFMAAHPWLASVALEASPAVMAELDDVGSAQSMVVTRRRPGHVRAWVPRPTRFDVSFVVFGPEYGWPRAHRRIIGFADGTAVFPRPRGVPAGSRGHRAKRAFRAWVSRTLLRDADRVVVEAEPVAAAIHRAVPGLKARIDVVPNCVNATLLRPPAAALPPVVASRGPRLLYVARAYPHKNHDFLGLVGEELDRRGIPVKFVVTLNPEEWKARTETFRLHADNVGPLGVEELATEYRKADAAVFPSLLESFSVTPLEGLALGKVVLASDRDFVRRVCGDAVLYFDPLDPRACADVIADWRTHPTEVEKTQMKATARLLAELPRPVDRARAYVRLIDQELLRR